MEKMFQQGFFQVDPNLGPEEVKKRRDRLSKMVRYGSAKSAPEGLTHLFAGIMAGNKNRKLDGIEREGREKATSVFDSIIRGQQPSTPGPMTMGGVAPPSPIMTRTEEEVIGDDTMAALGKPSQRPQPEGKDAFISSIMPHAMRVAEETGLDPRIIVAQAALETGWGKSAPGNNYFGIKSHGKPGGNTMATTEVINGETVPQMASFRAYDGMGDSVDGYADFLKNNPRYGDMLAAGDFEGQLEALGKSGYATDPNYTQKIRQIASGLPMQGQPAGAATSATSATQPNNMGALYEALQNPWLTQPQRQVVMSMIQQQQQENDPVRALDMQYKQAQIDALQNPVPKPTALQSNYQAAVKGGFEGSIMDYQVALEEAGAASTMIDMGEDKYANEFAKFDAQTMTEVGTAGLRAKGNLARISALEGMLANAPQGAVGAFKKIAGDFGIETDGLDDIQAATALINQMVPEQRPAGSGPMSDADLELFKQSLPRIINTPGGNQKIISTLRAIAEYDQAGAAIVQQHRAGKISREEAFQQLHDREHPLLSMYPAPPQAPGDAGTDEEADAVMQRILQERGQ